MGLLSSDLPFPAHSCEGHASRMQAQKSLAVLVLIALGTLTTHRFALRSIVREDEPAMPAPATPSFEPRTELALTARESRVARERGMMARLREMDDRKKWNEAEAQRHERSHMQNPAGTKLDGLFTWHCECAMTQHDPKPTVV